ncbi:unnamed protein product [Coccothraustes coccothraustes]
MVQGRGTVQEPSEWKISSGLLVAAKSGPQRVGCQPSSEGGDGKHRLLPEVPRLRELGKLLLPGELSLPGQLDGGTSRGASGRDPAALDTFQGEENELDYSSQDNGLGQDNGMDRTCDFEMVFPTTSFNG